MNEKYCSYVLIIIIVLILIFFMYTQCINEHFTAPGLTLTMPPSWFPQNAAKLYKMNDWKVRAYLDRYPFYDTKNRDYISYNESQRLASTNRFWKS